VGRRARGTLERSVADVACAIPAAPRTSGAVGTARRMRRLLDAAGDRANVLVSFVVDLDPDGGALLYRLLTDGHLPPDTVRPPTGSP
jgi:hypothetical protein